MFVLTVLKSTNIARKSDNTISSAYNFEVVCGPPLLLGPEGAKAGKGERGGSTAGALPFP
eukprot:3607593-Rhodomonas_salina.1